MSDKRRIGVFTIAQNEDEVLKLWAKHYGFHFGESNCFFLLHDDKPETQTWLTDRGCNAVPVHRSRSFDHVWLRKTVEDFFRFMLQSYDWVLFAEIDEIVVSHPGLPGFRYFLDQMEGGGQLCARLQGFEVMHRRAKEPAALNWQTGVLSQRSWWCPSQLYSKVLLSRIPLQWEAGFHKLSTRVQSTAVYTNANLRLLHLKRADFDYCWARTQESANRKWSENDIAMGRGSQNRITRLEDFTEWFYRPDEFGPQFESLVPEEIPDEWKTVI